MFGKKTATRMGTVIREQNRNAVFGFRIVYKPGITQAGLGLFQTQYGWWDPLDPYLIGESIKELGAYLRSHPATNVRLTYQSGLDLRAFKSLDIRIRRRITAVKRTRPPGPIKGFAPVEGVWE